MDPRKSILIALALAGCGSTSPTATVGAGPLFSRHCSVCHTLGTPASRSQMGGDLSGLKLPRSELRQFISEMPKHRGALTRSEIDTLVSYVASFEGHGHKSAASVG
ncbi:MAG: cytochrome c [Solirubrobacterales bacterium]|nr:cytochrome c [Solirubrobacterales bacterium]